MLKNRDKTDNVHVTQHRGVFL